MCPAGGQARHRLLANALTAQERSPTTMRLTTTRSRLGAIGATGLILAWLLLAACQPAAPVEPTTDPTPERPTFTPAAGEPQPTPTLEATPMNTPTLAQSLSSAEQRLLDLIGQDLSQQLQVKEPAVTIGAIERVTWPDTSLGCPQPGYMYAQVLTPGYRATVEVEGKTYVYHASDAGQLVLCAPEQVAAQGAPTVVTATAPTIEPGLEGIVAAAIDDLAQRLAVSPEQIVVVEAQAVVWPDASLGCPQPDMLYKQVPMDGALVRLEVADKVYDYHSGAGRAPFLCEESMRPHKDTPPAIDLLQLEPRSPLD